LERYDSLCNAKLIIGNEANIYNYKPNQIGQLNRIISRARKKQAENQSRKLSKKYEFKDSSIFYIETMNQAIKYGHGAK